jgi:Uma2 family endonuclease
MAHTQLARRPSPATPDLGGDERFVIYGVTWKQYSSIRRALEGRRVKLTYLRGTLELVSPGSHHEGAKTLFARLVELYALERDVALYGYGSTTFKKKAKERGLEPDECWCVGKDLRAIPDIAFEVIVTRPAVSKLEVYEGLGVPEVWLLERGKLAVHRLGERGYERRARSALLPGLDLEELARLIASSKDQDATVRAYRDRLRRGT